MGKRDFSEELEPAPIRLIKERRFANIPVDKIVIINSRKRDKKKFDDNVRSIDSVGLYKPILVNARNFKDTGTYELICGQGRLMAHQQLKKSTIPAEIVDLDAAMAQLITLSENIARNQPATIEYAYRLKDMHDHGVTHAELENITGHAKSYIGGLIKLVECGEERLVRGVENGIFTIQFALQVATADDGHQQKVLLDAFDKKLIAARHVSRARRLMQERTRLGKALRSPRAISKAVMSVDQLKEDVTRITQEKERFVYEAQHQEGRLYAVWDALKTIRNDEKFMQILGKLRLAELPILKGKYHD